MYFYLSPGAVSSGRCVKHYITHHPVTAFSSLGLRRAQDLPSGDGVSVSFDCRDGVLITEGGLRKENE